MKTILFVDGRTLDCYILYTLELCLVCYIPGGKFRLVNRTYVKDIVKKSKR